MILRKRIILTPYHPTWVVFRFIKTQDIKENKKLKVTIKNKKYEYNVEVIDEETQTVECFELIEVVDSKCELPDG